MRNSIISSDNPEHCFICNRRNPEHIHHCLHGSYRFLADKFGLTVHLCVTCHMNLHDKGTFDRELQKIAQKAFEERNGHELWMKVFHKNYLGE